MWWEDKDYVASLPPEEHGGEGLSGQMYTAVAALHNGATAIRMAQFFGMFFFLVAGFLLGFAAGRKSDESGYERGYKDGLSCAGKAGVPGEFRQFRGHTER
jgi:hypothetical protein